MNGRVPRSISTGYNMSLDFFCFYVVKPLMLILPFLCVCENLIYKLKSLTAN